MASEDLRTLPEAERSALAVKGPTFIFDGVCNLCNTALRFVSCYTRGESDGPCCLGQWSCTARRWCEVYVDKPSWHIEGFGEVPHGSASDLLCILLDQPHRYDVNEEDINKSWGYLKDGQLYRGSTAWLMGLRELTAPWCWAYYLIHVPEVIREFVWVNSVESP